ncbi:uncharacterized protein TNCV_3826831 [Trichonephila clavipes]|nr:uncharacterized protein TNCV_3826831 [Trichonephila clavipes]
MSADLDFQTTPATSELIQWRPTRSKARNKATETNIYPALFVILPDKRQTYTAKFQEMKRWGPKWKPDIIKQPIIHPTFTELAIYRRQHQQEYSPFSTAFRSAPYLSTVGPPSHIGILGNEVAGDLAKAVISNPVDPEDHMVLTSTEIYSRPKELICRTYVVPHVNPWYFQRHPGSAISFNGSRSYQAAFSRFSTGHPRCMNFEWQKREASQFTPNVTSVLFLLGTFCNVSGFPARRLLHSSALLRLCTDLWTLGSGLVSLDQMGLVPPPPQQSFVKLVLLIL